MSMLTISDKESLINELIKKSDDCTIKDYIDELISIEKEIYAIKSCTNNSSNRLE